MPKSQHLPKSNGNVTVTPIPTPPAPDIPSQVTLAWDASTTPDVKGYRVKYGKVSGIYDVTIDVGNVLQYTVTNLVAGTMYYFVVVAYDAMDVESVPSTELGVVAPNMSAMRLMSGNVVYATILLTVPDTWNADHNFCVPAKSIFLGPEDTRELYKFLNEMYGELSTDINKI